MSFQDPDDREAWAKRAETDRLKREAQRKAEGPRLLLETDIVRAVLMVNDDIVFEQAMTDALGQKTWSVVGRIPAQGGRGEVPWWIRTLLIDGRRP